MKKVERLNLANVYYISILILVLMYRASSSLLYSSFVWSCVVQ